MNATPIVVRNQVIMDVLAKEVVDLCARGDGVRIECPLQHIFTPGLYARTIFMPAGARVISEIHKTRHPYFVSQGRCRVVVSGREVIEIVAPYMGITEAGTQRALEIIEDTVWTTVHANPDNEQDVEKLAPSIIERYELPQPETAMTINYREAV